MTNNKITKRTRYPKTILVEEIELEPDVQLFVVTKDKYILELTEPDMRRIHDFLGKRLSMPIIATCRISVTGKEIP